MRRLIFRIRQRVSTKGLVLTIPKASLGALPMFISFELGLSLIVGYFTARYFAGEKTAEQGRLPSLTFDIKNYRIHLHHWLVFLGIFAAAVVANFFVAPLLFYGFLGGVIFQGVLYYDDWTKIVSKQKYS
jgi:hypothetical protein